MGKKLGQHFLRSRAVLDDILGAAALQPGEPVLEIGPGEGALTERLLEQDVRLTAVELDAVLAQRLRARWEDHPRFRLIVGDVLRQDLSPVGLFGAGAPYAVVANLPYYLSTPLLFRLIGHRTFFTRLVLMVQKEVANRMIAAPEDGKVYGSLSVAAGSAFHMQRVCVVPASAFRPPPKVDSAVVLLKPRAPVLTPGEEGRFLEHVKGLFTRRRKLMLSGLSEARPRMNEAEWERLVALVGNRRAETLTPEEHLTVFRLLGQGGVTGD